MNIKNAIYKSGRLLAALFSATLLAPAFAQEYSDGVIVQFHADSALSDKRLQSADQARLLGARIGQQLELRSGPAPQTHLVRGAQIDADTLAQKLAAEPGVKFAQPNRRKFLRATPNDPLFNRQWFLHDHGRGQPSSINAQSAWDISTGSPSIVVAVLDSGVRFDHEDLQGRLLPGYDFIRDIWSANDGDGMDADASDPGDFVAGFSTTAFLRGCKQTNSSWHGTQVAGLIAAAGNNSRGVSGLNWDGRILPVRVMGRCGGMDADIVAGMRWAGGLSVPGVPDNPHPAKVINLSVGGSTSCSPLYQETITQLQQRGVTVVAAAGNSGGSSGTGWVEEPANCDGVIAVGALRHNGTKVGYSSFGRQVDISAPGGNCVSEQAGRCLYPLVSTTNYGTQKPAANGYTRENQIVAGTSFSAPLVAGTAALLLSVKPDLSPADILRLLRQSARPFPQEENLPSCEERLSVVQSCNCTTKSCGAGMLNAGAALQQLKNEHVVTSAPPVAQPAPQPVVQPQPQAPAQPASPPEKPADSSGGGGAFDGLIAGVLLFFWFVTRNNIGLKRKKLKNGSAFSA